MDETSVKFVPLASSSKGNSIFIGTPNTKVLVDAGVSCKRLEGLLESIGEKLENIDAIFVTHEHSDHIAGCSVTSRKYDIPIYATTKTWKYMLHSPKVGDFKKHNVQVVCPGEEIFINEIKVKHFNISHDAAEPVGYAFWIGDEKIAVATDLGCVTEEVLENLQGCNKILLESNHDVKMLKEGRYPYSLKKRVFSDYGHLSNENCGKFLVLLNSDSLEEVYLGHLSEENNVPELAFETVVNVLKANGIMVPKDINIKIAPRDLTC